MLNVFINKKKISYVYEDPRWVLHRFLIRLGLKGISDITITSTIQPINVLGKLDVEEF